MNKRLESADSYWETIEKETEKDFEIIEAVLKADRMNLSFFHPNGTSPKFVIDACNSHASNKKLIGAIDKMFNNAKINTSNQEVINLVREYERIKSGEAE